MRILALDVAVHMGYAAGKAGTIPNSGSVRLRDRKDPPEVAWCGCFGFLRDWFRAEDDRPDLCVMEAPHPPAAHRSADAALLGIGLYSQVYTICWAYGVRFEAVDSKTVSKHFVGVGRFMGGTPENNRKRKKMATLERAILLKYLPPDCRDYDRADAIAVFDYAVAHWARNKAIPELHLFKA